MGAQISRVLEEHRGLVLSGVTLGTLALVGAVTYHRRCKEVMDFGEWEVDRASFNKKDVVYLIIPPRIGAIPSISPFCLKVETWLRMANIPHEVVESLMLSPSKQMFPYIYLNGEEIADSHFIVERVSKHFGKSVDKHLTELEKGISVAYSILLEEHLVFTYAWHRYLINPDKFWGNFLEKEKLGRLGQVALGFRDILKSTIKTKCWDRGIGRHSPEEIYAQANEDLKAISTYLGSRDFFFGREPSLIDCTIFAHTAQILCLDPYFPPGRKMLDEYKNLQRHMERMKYRYYSDWDRLCHPLEIEN